MGVKTRGKAQRYRGLLMKSGLEVRHARFFDLHAMRWAYEPERFDLGDFSYTPDFGLIELGTIVEVKGLLDALDRAKLGALAAEAGRRDVLVVLCELEPGYDFRLVRPVAGGGCELSDDVALVRCFDCSRWQFLDGREPLRCRFCQAWRPDESHIGAVHPSGGRKRPLQGDCCRECGALEGVLVKRSYAEW